MDIYIYVMYKYIYIYSQYQGKQWEMNSRNIEQYIQNFVEKLRKINMLSTLKPANW